MSSSDEIAPAYRALREGVGAHGSTVDVVSVRGPDATSYLQGQLSQDLAPVSVGGSVPALLLEPDGKLCALVRATKAADDAWLLDCDTGYGERARDRLARYVLRTKVTIELAAWRCVALRGAGVAALDAAAGSRAAADEPDAGAPPWVLPVEWNGTTGVDLLGPGADELVPADTVWCPDAAWEALRVEAGIPKMGAELTERTIAAEAGLVARAVSLTKGCYTGQELIARLDARGNRVARRLCGVVVEDLAPSAAGDLVGATLWAPGRDSPAGRCTSAAWCPGLGAVGAIAYLHRSVDVPGPLRWGPGEDGGPPGDAGPAASRPLPLVGS